MKNFLEKLHFALLIIYLVLQITDLILTLRRLKQEKETE